MLRLALARLLGCSVVLSTAALSNAAEPADSTWTVRPLAIDANEGLALGDIDGDGRIDVVSGRQWYAAPDFVPRPLRAIDDWNGYLQSNGDFLFDLNGDGHLDVIAGSFLPTEVQWFENPGPEGWRLGQSFKPHRLIDTQRSENEAHLFTDVDADGLPDWVVNSWNPKNPVVVYRMKPSPTPGEGGLKYRFEATTIAAEGNKHGMGVGDLNGDGRVDVLTGAGWYEQPEGDAAWNAPWPFRANWSIEGSIPMIVHDLDGDGLADVLVGEGHDFGLYWWRQTGREPDGQLVFDRRLIDKSYSQPHALALADLDGDGRVEIISGKRYYAHNGGDPGGQDRPEVHAYAFDPKTKAFTDRLIEKGHVGIGLQIGAADLDQDGRIDLALPGKSGTYLLFQR